MVIGLAWPVTASADHGGDRHDQCLAAAGAEPGEDCPVTAAAVVRAMPTTTPAPSASPSLPTSPEPAASAPATKPLVSPDGLDLRTTILGSAGLAALVLLVVSGFGARRRLRQGWDDGGSDTSAG